MSYILISSVLFVLNILFIREIFAVNVSTPEEFKNALESSNDITLIIKNKIEFNESEKISIGNSVSEIEIKGVSPNTSKLIINEENGLIFSENIKNIIISDITIDSSIFFNDNKNITIENVNIDGFISGNFSSLSDNSFRIIKTVFNHPKKPISNLLKIIEGNIEIDNCQFYGNENLLVGAISIHNQKNLKNYGKVSIDHSLIDGGYKGTCVMGNYISDFNIKNTEIKNCLNENLYYYISIVLSFIYFN